MYYYMFHCPSADVNNINIDGDNDDDFVDVQVSRDDNGGAHAALLHREAGEASRILRHLHHEEDRQSHLQPAEAQQAHGQVSQVHYI